MRRALRIALGISALSVVQLGAWLLYRWVEHGRGADPSSQSFAYEAATGAAPGRNVLLERADGSAARLSDYGGSPVVLHFWATWCAPCRTELPALIEAAARYPHAVLLLVSVDESWEVVRHFFGGEIPPSVVRDPRGSLRDAYGVTVLPDTHFLRPGGALAARLRGSRDWRAPSAREGIERLTAPR